MFFKRIFSLFLSLLDMLVILLGGNGIYMSKTDVSVTLNDAVEYQVFDGFGASSCWWAQVCGDSASADEVAKTLYSKDGLGLNIYRYNVGGGSKDNPDSRIDGWRATESFYYYNENTGKYEYDFTRDAAAQQMLDKCLSYGCIDTVVLFANSPHYSMTVSGQATGGLEEYVSNLPEENYEAYADYFLTITEYFLDKGVPVRYISPVNEPQWAWGGSWVGQEGCHYEKEEVVELFRVFARKIKERNIDVKLMGPESGEVGDITEWYFDALYNDPEIREALGSLAYHSYWSDGNTFGKATFGSFVNRKYSSFKVDMTEWCELPCELSINDFDAALLMARVISQDLALSNANSWSAWVGVNGSHIREDGERYSDGILASNDDCSEIYMTVRYYAMAHYSKYIPVGSVRISAESDLFDFSVHKAGSGSYVNTKSLNISAFKTPEGKIVCVLVNEGDSRNAQLNITQGNMQIVTSTADAQLQTVYEGSARSLVELPADSITTVIYG